MDEDNIHKLPIKFKSAPTDETFLKVVDSHFGTVGCSHRQYVKDGKIRHVRYLLRDGETEVECSQCGTKLDPMFVLKILAREENSWNETRKRYNEEMKRLGERSRTKCQYCERMTRISR